MEQQNHKKIIYHSWKHMFVFVTKNKKSGILREICHSKTVEYTVWLGYANVHAAQVTLKDASNVFKRI